MTTDPYLLIVPASLVLGLVAGYVMHRADFCIAGMFRDLFLFGHTFMLKMLVLLIVISMVGFEVARRLDLLSQYPFPLLGQPSLANVLGGMLFGAGMVLAGGCVVGTLYKLGAGSAISLAALAGLIAGSALYADLQPWWSVVTRKLAVFPPGVTLAQMLKVSPGVPIVAASIVGAGMLLYWNRGGQWLRRSGAEGYLQPWKAAVLLALVSLASYVLVGMPLGITTAYAKAGAFVESWVVPGHLRNLAYFSTEGLHYTPPFFGVPVSGGAGPHLDAIAAIQFPLIAGIVLGGTLSAVLVRELKLYLRVPWPQYASAFTGGLAMGLAARMAPSCNVWHLLGGLPILAVQSLLFLLGLLPGAWIGTRLLTRLVLARG